ncbi:MAG: hypothetical protein MRZ79_18340 [Bacteroidia bacterium]|nr:hypothetical protein [Bacteroidia bacterium]
MRNDLPFIQKKEQLFYLKGNPHFFLGTNFWYGANLGSLGKGGDRERLIRELDLLASLGLNNLRVMALSEGGPGTPWCVQPAIQSEPGVFNEELLLGLDFLLDEMRKRNMFAVMVLGNFWPWSGGMAQYLSWVQNSKIPYPPPAKNGNWARYQLYTSSFYSNKKAKKLYWRAVDRILSRVNSINQIPYKEDPSIFSWQLANEPRPILSRPAYLKWIRDSILFIRERDTNHLLSLGSEGSTSSRWAGTRFLRDHSLKGIDYATFHLWVQNWGWYDPTDAENSFETGLEMAKDYFRSHINDGQKTAKPLVFEEFGIARDENSHDPKSSTRIRDQYYRELFSLSLEQAKKGKLSGLNFWSWGGFGRPKEPKAIWKTGNDLIGDPPHEHQGWYSVYDKDHSTLEVIKEFSQKFNLI